jgi:NADH-quinone oxidoreductase E subunit
MANELLEKHRGEVEKILAKYPQRRSAMLPLLWLVQEKAGWIVPERVQDVADLAGASPTEVMECVTFYTMYHQAPPGKYHIRVCTTLPCALRGAEGLSECLQKKLNVEAGAGPTKDGKWSLENVECLGACINAPMMLINDREHYRLNRAKVDEILDGLK